MPKLFSNWIVGLLLLPWAVSMADTIHHDLDLRLDPASGEIEVSDKISLPPALRKEPVFTLSAGLQPEVEEGQLTVLSAGHAGSFRQYRYQGELNNGQLLLRYRGRFTALGARPGQGMPIGLISEDGVYLDGAAGWYPAFGDRLQSYRLRVKLPPGWQGMSTGTRRTEGAETVWEAPMPQDDIYLLAGPFSAYQCRSSQTRLEVLLLAPDELLAQDYLQAASRYLALFSELFGKYPYGHFAVVENRWQTGFGMPSFTLLGSRVLRLPFILDSSLPHEIVHNWWGNSVFLSAEGGNWSEGLTAYLADHLIKEMAGQGADYRRKALERYANFAASERDFPLRAFRARHDEASQAVGYSKTMMLFHMIRRELGDGAFIAALRDFYQRYRFQRASFDDLLGVFASHGQMDPVVFQRNWLDKAGAPKLVLQSAEVDGNRLTIELRQTQSGPAYPLTVPLAVTLAGESEARWLKLQMTTKRVEMTWTFPSRPLRIDVDPAFDLFRQLLPGERPASLGRLFGSTEQLLVIPSRVNAEEQDAWHQLAAQWQRRYRNVRVVDDSQIDSLPEDTAIWLLGWDNSLLQKAATRFGAAGQTVTPDGVLVAGERIDPERQAVVLLDPDNGRPPLGFIGSHGEQAIVRLAGKLTHYGSFGRLVFDLPEVSNRLREGLAVTHSPLSRIFNGTSTLLKLPVSQSLSAQLDTPDSWSKVQCR